MDRKITNVLALSSVVLYSTGYWISEYFYWDDIVKWRSLRDTLNSIVIFILVLMAFLPRTRFKTAVFWSFGILCFGDLVDRLLFNIDVFIWTDYFLIAIAVIVFLYKYKGHEPHTG
jgi:hypothetical protein